MSRAKTILWWILGGIVLAIVLAPVAFGKYQRWYIQNLREQGYYIRDEGLRAAIEQKNPELCGKIKVPFGFMEPDEMSQKQHCYYDVAQTSRDAAICRRYLYGTSYQDSCVIDVAVKRDDIEMCDLVTDAERKDICMERVIHRR